MSEQVRAASPTSFRLPTPSFWGISERDFMRSMPSSQVHEALGFDCARLPGERFR